MQHNTAIGIMDEAYFVPRQSIIQWINHYLKLQVNVIEDLGTGAVYCQLLDAAFGQRVPMSKINWKAKFQYQFISNLKLFQTTLDKLGITKKIDVLCFNISMQIQKLAKAKYQDNLEMIQWLKRYIEISGNISEDYPAERRRGNAQLYAITQSKKVLGTSFKTNYSFLNNTTITNLNQSICSTTNGKNKQQLKHRVIQNKENNFNQNKKKSLPFSSSASRLDQKMNEIKKILMSNDSSDNKVCEINEIVFGKSAGNKSSSSSCLSNVQSMMQIQAAESDDQELVF